MVEKEEDDLEAEILYEQILKLLKEAEVPLRDLDLKIKPTFDIENILASSQLK